MEITASSFKVMNETPEKMEQLNEALAYLKKSPTAEKVLAAMVANGVTIRFVENKTDVFHPDQAVVKENVPTMSRVAGDNQLFPANTIDWDPNAFLKFTDANHSENPKTGTNEADADVRVQGVLSPSLMLIHEGGHAVDTNYKDHFATKNIRYGDNAEQYAGEKVENAVASELSEGTRLNHGGTYQTIKGVSPTLHTIPNENSDTLHWQEQFLNGGLVVTGGEFKKVLIGKDKNSSPNIGSYESDTKTLTSSNTSISVADGIKDITIKGNNSVLNLSENANITTEGKFTVHYGKDGKQTEEVEGLKHITIHNGKLEVTNVEAVSAPKSTPNISKEQHSQLDTNNPNHQLANVFDKAIKNPDPQDPQLLGLAQKHQELVGSIAFYNSAKAQLPETTTEQIANHLVNEIKSGRPLQLAMNDRPQEINNQAMQA